MSAAVDVSKDTPEAAMALLGAARFSGEATYAWADGLGREEAYVRLIDAYRLLVEDSERFMGRRRGLAAGADPEADFASFLAAARTRRGLLPAPWTDADDAAAVAVGRAHVWASLRRRAGKSAIVAAYGYDGMLHALLRRLAEAVEGVAVCTGGRALRYGADGRVIVEA